MNASWQVDYATWDQLKTAVQEAFGVELVSQDDEFSYEELYCALCDRGLDPCRYQRGDLWRVHADRATNWWGEHKDICFAAARAAMSWWLSRPGNDLHPIYRARR